MSILSFFSKVSQSLKKNFFKTVAIYYDKSENFSTVQVSKKATKFDKSKFQINWEISTKFCGILKVQIFCEGHNNLKKKSPNLF